jgi:superfamily I DNA/RNA helicase
MTESDYLQILSTLRELPFPIGKKTLSEILSGAVTKKIVANEKYMDLEGYGALSAISQAQIEQWIDRLHANDCIMYINPPGQPHMKVLKITAKGIKELKDPTLEKKSFSSNFKSDAVDDASLALIEHFSFFLSAFNGEQQHAIVSPAKRILCVAGAGTGKTTVLTKRVEFLVRYRGVNPQKILAITFTRKARAEMQVRLAGLPVEITTFNGFCERILRLHGLAKPLLTYGQKIRLFKEVLAQERIDIHQLTFDYFTDAQRKGATKDELERRLMGDVYSLIDHYANEDEEMPIKGKSILATTLLGIARQIQIEMKQKDVRDYSGQLRDALAFLRRNLEKIPKFDHILVDEYQDVNVAQERLLALLQPSNLFVVGDPRQSIFGWRGSQIRYITEFNADTTIQLKTNYRSGKEIVDHMNKLIAGMSLPELSPAKDTPGAVQTIKYASEDEELSAIATLLEHATQKEIFVLARTNRQLQDLSTILSQRGVPHTIKHEEDERAGDGIVLATVHAIKGLEASTVIVIGATSRYFPCKVSDHPVIDLIKDSYLDKEEEERRLLYVAVSRAKDILIITYTSTPTYFFDGVLHEKPVQKNLKQPLKPMKADSPIFEKLRTWRSQTARKRGVPAFIICTDRTLQELALVHPRTLTEMEGIYGLGDTKIRQFGAQLLEAMR